MFRKLENIAKINPEIAKIREESKCHSDRVLGYIELLFRKLSLYCTDETKEIAMKIYKDMRVEFRLSDQDPRKTAAGIVFYSAVVTGSRITKEDIIEVLKPMGKVTVTK